MRVEESLATLREARAQHEAVLVAYSGGKDSLCVLDLCTRVFPHVEAYYTYFVPGLAIVEEMLDFARATWGVTIHTYPSFQLPRALKSGIYAFPSEAFADMPEWSLTDVWNLAKADTGINLIADGQKRADSFARRRAMANTRQENVIHPIAGWIRHDVYAYLKARNIPLPESYQADMSGVTLVNKSLLWMYENHRADFEKMKRYFPLLEVVIRRKQWHGIPKD